jgi:hypothetical protein
MQIPAQENMQSADCNRVKTPATDKAWRQIMTLKDYFTVTDGVGVLSTADQKGIVDAALYSKPHCMEDGTLAFIMRDRLTHANIESNPHATYLFIEDGPGKNGKRLYLTKIRQEKNSELLFSIRRRSQPVEGNEDLFLVYFTLDRERPLVGD